MNTLNLDKDIIKTYYVDQELTTRQIGKILGCNQKTICNYLKKYNIEARQKKFEVFEDYFYKWSDSSAYILGYTLADGTINDKCSRTISLRYECKISDIEILEFIRNEITPTTPIKQRSKTLKSNGKTYYTTTLQIDSTKLCMALNDLGIYPRKSGFERLPKIPPKYLYSFLRGFFDGDGSIFGSGGKRYGLSFASGSKQLLESINTEIIDGLGHIYSKKSKCFELKIAKISHVDRVINLIYQTDGFKLKRKYNRCMDLQRIYHA